MPRMYTINKITFVDKLALIIIERSNQVFELSLNKNFLFVEVFSVFMMRGT